MPRVRETAFLAEKWVTNATNASPNYRRGVEQPLNSWQQNATKAAGAWEQGVQQAIQRKAYAAGVNAAGDETWRRAAIEKGAQRYAGGVQFAKDKWAQKWDPYRQVIEGTTLPERGPKGSAQNYERAVRMGQALREAKLRRTGGGGGR